MSRQDPRVYPEITPSEYFYRLVGALRAHHLFWAASCSLMEISSATDGSLGVGTCGVGEGKGLWAGIEH